MANSSFSRVANGLVESIAADTAPFSVGRDSELPVLAKSLSDFERRSPGLWVGGRLSISDDEVTFTPNAMNRATYSAIGERIGAITVPFSSIQSVHLERALVTNIVRIRTAEFVISARCFGAKAVAARIRPSAKSD